MKLLTVILSVKIWELRRLNSVSSLTAV